MSDVNVSQEKADAINQQMVLAMDRRRLERPERRRGSGAPRVERRRTCGYCFQQGDHQTPAACLRALER